MSAAAGNQPIVMRWHESVSDGYRTWYIGALRNDGSFWGYVHARQDSFNENRSFDGRLHQDDYDQIATILSAIAGETTRPMAWTATNGVIGFGSRSQFDILMKYDADRTDAVLAELFNSVVSILNPATCKAAKLDFDGLGR